ncbi:MAG: hypothetical protein GC201_05075 [Alphaproteobacteria bacterium]|nr:hypothetical protein [Alphaproteobacteria bacterium]
MMGRAPLLVRNGAHWEVTCSVDDAMVPVPQWASERGRTGGAATAVAFTENPGDPLYGDFFARHRDTLKGNRRLAMVYRRLERFGDRTRLDMSRHADRLKASLERL